MVVFVTSYDQYALQAFEVSAVDYLLKPVAEERLAKALAKARDVLQAKAARQVAHEQLDRLAAVLNRQPRPGKQTLVNLNRVVELDPILKGGAVARLTGGATVEISRRYATGLRDRLGW